jgi:hypothetical protein
MAKEEAPNADDPPSLVAGTTFIQLEHNWPCMLCRCLLALQPTPANSLVLVNLAFSRQILKGGRDRVAVRAGVAAEPEPERNGARSPCLHYSDPRGAHDRLEELKRGDRRS